MAEGTSVLVPISWEKGLITSGYGFCEKHAVHAYDYCIVDLLINSDNGNALEFPLNIGEATRKNEDDVGYEGYSKLWNGTAIYSPMEMSNVLAAVPICTSSCGPGR